MSQREELNAGRWETLEKVDREIKSWCSRHVALLCVNNATLRSRLRCSNTLVNVTEFNWRHHGKLRQRGGGETDPAFNSIYRKSKRSESPAYRYQDLSSGQRQLRSFPIAMLEDCTVIPTEGLFDLVHITRKWWRFRFGLFNSSAHSSSALDSLGILCQ